MQKHDERHEGDAMRNAGMLNPRSDYACGAVDRTARIPEPMHYDCNKCHARIVALLELRVTHPHRVEQEQKSLIPSMEVDL